MNGIKVALLAGLMMVLACESDPAKLPDLSVATVTVTPAGRTLVAGQSMQLTAYPKTADGTVLGGRRVDWSSDAAGVATVGANGAVQALTPGAARIVAEVEGRTGSVQVTVVAAPLQVATIEIMNAPARLEVGGQVMLEAVLRAADGTVVGGRTVTWSTSHGPTATVNTNPNSSYALLSGHSPGAVVIRAEADGREASVAVAVEAPAAPIGSIVLNPSDANIWVGGAQRYEATVLKPGGGQHPSPPAIAWSVDDPSVASVDLTGRVTGLRPGTTHVRATIGNVQGGAKVTVHATFAGRQRFFLDAERDPSGNPREVVLGTLTWYGDSVEGEAARELLRSGVITVETVNGVLRYAQQMYFDVMVGEGVNARQVAFGSITDTGTVETLFGQAGDAPTLRFISDSAQNLPFLVRMETGERLVSRQIVAAAPVLDYLWVRE